MTSNDYTNLYDVLDPITVALLNNMTVPPNISLANSNRALQKLMNTDQSTIVTELARKLVLTKNYRFTALIDGLLNTLGSDFLADYTSQDVSKYTMLRLCQHMLSDIEDKQFVYFNNIPNIVCTVRPIKSLTPTELKLYKIGMGYLKKDSKLNPQHITKNKQLLKYMRKAVKLTETKL